MDDELLALIALLRYTDARKHWRATVAEVRECGALEPLRRLQPDTLLEDDPLADLLKRSADELSTWTKQAQVLSLFDPNFPAQLRDVHDLPPLLFARGTLADDRGACIVGSRKASPDALKFAYDVATQLARRHIPVVSGLAAGIDTAAHRGALDAGGRTIAVIGTGIDQNFPPENKDLQTRIESDGLVLSQFWPGSSPTRISFPMRNATMSAYGMCTLVAAAGEQSGARIQARQAVAHGRPLLLSRAVVNQTNWGKRLAASTYDVRVVDGVDSAVDAIETILNRPHELEDLLVELTR